MRNPILHECLHFDVLHLNGEKNFDLSVSTPNGRCELHAMAKEIFFQPVQLEISSQAQLSCQGSVHS